MMTITTIADRLNVPRHRVAFALRHYGPPPTIKAGRTYLWDVELFPQIINALSIAAARRKSGKGITGSTASGIIGTTQ